MQHVGSSSLTRDRTGPPCMGSLETTREVPSCLSWCASFPPLPCSLGAHASLQPASLQPEHPCFPRTWVPHTRAPFWLAFGEEVGAGCCTEEGIGLVPAPHLLGRHCPLPSTPCTPPNVTFSFPLPVRSYIVLFTALLSRSHGFQSPETYLFLGAPRPCFSNHGG